MTCRENLKREMPKINSADKVYDSVSHPSHYTYGKIECIDFIFDKNLSHFCLEKMVTAHFYLGFNKNWSCFWVNFG